MKGNKKMLHKKLISGAVVALSTLIGSQVFAASGQYTASGYWNYYQPKSYGFSKLGVTYVYSNHAEIAHGGLVASGASQYVKASTGFSLTAKILDTNQVLLDASVRGDSKNYQSNGTDFYRASGSIKILGNDYLPYTNYYDFNDGTATLQKPFVTEGTLFRSPKIFYGCNWQLDLKGKLEGEVGSQGRRRSATASTNGYERGESYISAGAGLTAVATCYDPAAGTKLGSLPVNVATVDVTPNAYASEDIYVADPQASRARYRFGINTPVTIRGGSGRVEIAGYGLVNWPGFSTTISSDPHDHDERFGTTWY